MNAVGGTYGTRLLATFGRLPGTWLHLGLIVAAGITEGLGLTLFIPLLEIMGGGASGEISWPFDAVIRGLASVGLPTDLTSLLVAIAALVLGAMALAYEQRRRIIRAKLEFVRSCRTAIAANLFRANWSHISAQSHGEIVNQSIIECLRAGNALQYEIFFVATALQIAIYFAFSTLISWPLMLCTLLFGGLLVLVVHPLQVRAKIYGEDTNVVNRDFSFASLDFLRGAKLIKVTATEEPVLARLGRVIGDLFGVSYRSELNGVQVYFLAQAMPVLLITLLIGIAHQLLSVELAHTLVFLLILARVAPRIAQLQQYVQEFNAARPALRVVDEMVAASAAERERAQRGGIPFETLRDGIVLDQVSYRYPDREAQAVEDVDLEIPVNRMVALVGSSGAGKTTVVDLIAGLYRADRGRVLIDGVDLDEIDLATWRRRIGCVTQDVVVFNDTVRNNLLFAFPEAEAATIAEALRLSHFEQVVAQLPAGMETELGEAGVRLSGGQKQRLALARALIGRPALLLLDEATSALDNESERLIQDSIDSLRHQLTILVVAHRLSTVRKADVIYVMEHGRVVETGTYDDLVARDGRLARLHELQFN